MCLDLLCARICLSLSLFLSQSNLCVSRLGLNPDEGVKGWTLAQSPFSHFLALVLSSHSQLVCVTSATLPLTTGSGQARSVLAKSGLRSAWVIASCPVSSLAKKPRRRERVHFNTGICLPVQLDFYWCSKSHTLFLTELLPILWSFFFVLSLSLSLSLLDTLSSPDLSFFLLALLLW